MRPSSKPDDLYKSSLVIASGHARGQAFATRNNDISVNEGYGAPPHPGDREKLRSSWGK